MRDDLTPGQVPAAGALRVREVLQGSVQATPDDLLNLWRLSGGTIYANARGVEAGYMVTPKLLVFLRHMVEASRVANPIDLALSVEELETFLEWRRWNTAEDLARKRRAGAVDVEASEVPSATRRISTPADVVDVQALPHRPENLNP